MSYNSFDFHAQMLPARQVVLQTPSVIPVAQRFPFWNSPLTPSRIFPVVDLLYFHAFTKCFSRNSFVFNFMHFDGGVYPLLFQTSNVQASNVQLFPPPLEYN